MASEEPSSSTQRGAGPIVLQPTSSDEETDVIPAYLLNAEFYRILEMRNSTATDITKKMGVLIPCGFDVNSIYNGHTTALHVACEFRNVELVRYLLPIVKDIRKKDTTDEDSVVHSAAIGGSVDVMKILLSPNQVPDLLAHVNKRGHSPLHQALGKGRESMAKYLMYETEAGLSHCDKTGATLLHFAARNGNSRLLQLLQEASRTPMDVNQTSNAGLTALHYAAWNGKVNAIGWLLAQQNIKLHPVDKVQHNTALHWAAMGKHWGVVMILIQAHIRRGTLLRVFKTNKRGETMLEVMENSEAPITIFRILLQLFEEQHLWEMKAFPPIVLVKYVMGYGCPEMVHKLARSMKYALEKRGDFSSKEAASYRYLKALKTLVDHTSQDYSDFMSWLAKKPHICRESAELFVELKRSLDGENFKDSAVANALRDAVLQENRIFADVLARYGRLELSDQKGKTLLQQWLDCMNKDLSGNLTSTAESMLNQLSNTQHKAGLTTAEELIDEIPLAFWIYESPRGQLLASFLDDNSSWEPVVNKQGQNIKRTALHWANIFDRQDIARNLCQLKELQEGIADAYGKASRKYARESQKEERSVYMDALKSILVAAAMIASISFAGFMTSPLGYPSTSLVNNFRLRAFWVISCLSFFSAMASALVCIGGLLPISIASNLSRIQAMIVIKIENTLLIASGLLVFAICTALSAFLTGVLTIAPQLSRQRKHSSKVIVASCAGIAICAGIVMWFFVRRLFPLLKQHAIIKRLQHPRRKRTETSGSPIPHQSLPTADRQVAHQVPEYRLGSRYAEYPWEDGLDKLHEQYEEQAKRQQQENKKKQEQEQTASAKVTPKSPPLPAAPASPGADHCPGSTSGRSLLESGADYCPGSTSGRPLLESAQPSVTAPHHVCCSCIWQR